jgi:cytochrome c556
MKYWLKHLFAAGLAVAVIGAGLAATQPVNADQVKDRKAEMKKISKANKAIKKAVKAGNKSAARKQARNLIAAVDRVSSASMWPRGTGRNALGKRATRAKAKIWKDWQGFENKFAATRKVARSVAKGNLAAAKGIGKTCGGCHKQFRGKKAKKR